MTRPLWIVCVVISFWSATALASAAAAGKETQEQKLDRLFREASELDRKGNHAGVEAKMTQAIALEPTEPGSYFNRALARQKSKRFDAAKEDIDEFLELLPGDEDGLVLRAQIQLARNKLSDAVQDADEVLEDNPESHLARGIRAQAYKMQGRHREALEDFEKLWSMDVRDDATLAGRAECELALGLHSQAKLSFKTLIERIPENGWLHSKLAQAQFGLLEFEDALASHRKAESLKMARGDTQRSIGYCHFALKDDENAIAALKAAIAARPTITPYAYLVLHLAVRRAEKSIAESPLREAIAGWESDWAQALGRYLLGETSDRELVDLAKAATDDEERDEQLCEAYYYIGMTRQLEMDTVAAEVFFQRVLGTRATTFIEYTFSKAEVLGR